MRVSNYARTIDMLTGGLYQLRVYAEQFIFYKSTDFINLLTYIRI